MRLPVLIAAVALLAPIARAQRGAVTAFSSGTFVEAETGSWRVFPDPPGALAADDTGMRLRSWRGDAAIEVLLPAGWTVDVENPTSTRFHLFKSTTSRQLRGARSLRFVSPNEDASISLSLPSLGRAVLRWQAQDPGALVGIELRLLGGHDGGVLRERVAAWSGGPLRWVGDTAARLRLEVDSSYASALDPLVQELTFGTFLGGGGSEGITDLETDSAGNLIIAAATGSMDFPSTPSAYDPVGQPGSDSSVACLSRDGETLIFATFFGGTERDTVWDLEIDDDGSYVIAGYTESDDLPVTAGAYDTTYNGSTEDGFVARISSDGSQLLGCTYIGGSAPGNDRIDHLSIDDNDGSIVITGFTCSPDWPTTPGSLLPSNPGTCGAFVSRLSSDLYTLTASTYVGGIGLTNINGSLVTSDGTVVVSGSTSSTPGFPITLLQVGAFRTAAVPDDAYLMRLSPQLDSVVWSTWSQGGFEQIHEKPDGSLVLVGETFSDEYPITPGAFSDEFTGNPNLEFELVVSAISGDALTMIWSTYVTSNGQIFPPAASAIDDQGRVFFCGSTATPLYPFTPDAFDTTLTGLSETQLTVLDPTGSSVLYASLIGVGAGPQTPLGALALDDCGGAFVSSKTFSRAFPTTPGAFDETHNGFDDAWIVRITALNPWSDRGFGLPGAVHAPRLSPSGPLCEGDATSVDVLDGPPFASGFLVIGLSEALVSLKGGVLVPTADFVKPIPLDGAGSLMLDFDWPAGAASGFEFWLQAWVVDPTAIAGFSATNGAKGVTP